jgi:hypothetical protein
MIFGDPDGPFDETENFCVESNKGVFTVIANWHLVSIKDYVIKGECFIEREVESIGINYLNWSDCIDCLPRSD